MGKREQMQAQQNTAVTHTSSQIVSLGKGGADGKSGNIDLSALGTTTITGSQVMAPGGDITISGANVLINEAVNTVTQASQTRFKETAASVQLKSGYVDAVKGAAKSIDTARTAKKDTGSDRMAALATLNAAASVYNAYQDVSGSAGAASASAAPISAISISGSIGQSKSQSYSTSGQSIAQGSTIAAGNCLSIVANGDKAAGNGNLTMIGTNASAGKEATLDAAGDLNLLASSNTATSRSTNSGSNASMGATFALGGAQNGLSFQAGAQGSKGRANGDEVTYNNTTVTVGTAQAPGALNLKSGGNTTLKGATASADTINADIKGNLAIESLQDKAIYDSKQTSAGAGVSVCIPPICYGTMVAVNVNAAQTKIKADHDSVGLQSGLNAGDGGFNVQVGGKTDLVGGQITSTDKAVTDHKNQFTSAGPVTTTDLQNKSALDASSVSVNVSVSGGGASTGSTGGMAGYGSVNDSQTSTTRAGISGIAGNTAARTGDAPTGLKPVFTQQDADKINKSLSVQTSVTADFGKNSAKFVGDVAGSKQKELTEAAAAADKAGNKAEADRLTAEASLWSEGGAYRVSMHLVAGAMGGGVNGAAGAATSAIAAPVLDQIQAQMTDSLIAGGMNRDLARATASVLTLGAATTLAGAAGGVQGAATGFNVDANNRMLHPSEVARARQLAAASGGKYTAEKIEEQMRLMGNASLGVVANTTEVLIGDAAVKASDTQDPTMPRIRSGMNDAVEVPGQADAGLQRYIIANTKDGSGYIPGVSPYSVSNTSLNAPTIINTPPSTQTRTANCANNDLACRSGVGVQQNAPLTQQTREAIADGASTLSRQAGVVAAGAVAVSSQAGPYGQSAKAVAVGATVIGFGADVVEQVMKPNTGQTLVNLIGTGAGTLVEQLPGGKAVAPLTNEIIEAGKNSSAAQTVTSRMNQLLQPEASKAKK